MSESGEGDARTLAELRDRIDAIDAEMHRLLIARGAVIDTLIRVKGTSRPGAAFRPAREAEMMRRLVGRHHGTLPLTTVEHIWREIITTFTRMQAPFDIAMDVSVEPERMRDLARFYFGFSVNLVSVPNPAAAIARVAKANDLGLVARDQPASAGAWWRGLTGPSSPRIMAFLPHIGAEGRPADLPAFVISPRLSDPTPPEIRICAAKANSALAGLPEAQVLARAEDEVLVALPASREIPAGYGDEDIVEVGGTARGIAVDGAPSMLYQSLDRKGARR
jgi:chorismate mutase/prephenate dehydratase